tara:strand:- start:67 stop:726 length:660 start_codon:yes stop_codon:yes gene_type:complete
LSKRLSAEEKEEIYQRLLNGSNIEDLSKQFGVTKITITRNLKKLLDKDTYENLFKKIKVNSSLKNKKKLVLVKDKKIKNENNSFNTKNVKKEKELIEKNDFIEIAPLNFNIDIEPQKDLTSIDIKSFNFPKIVYLIVNKKIELDKKLLKDYPEWQFLSADDLEREIIEIFFDIKSAKRSCNKEQKVIKLPNPEVLKLVAPILISRGITRIISEDKLIAL